MKSDFFFIFVNECSPPPLFSSLLSLQDSLELHHNLSPSQSPGPNSNQIQLDQPFPDDRVHNRRPSDEAAIILRKISGTGPPPSLGMINMGMSVDRTASLSHAMRIGIDGLMGFGGSFEEPRYNNTLGMQGGGWRGWLHSG